MCEGLIPIFESRRNKAPPSLKTLLSSAQRKSLPPEKSQASPAPSGAAVPAADAKRHSGRIDPRAELSADQEDCKHANVNDPFDAALVDLGVR
jgi:hypothetical protein